MLPAFVVVDTATEAEEQMTSHERRKVGTAVREQEGFGAECISRLRASCGFRAPSGFGFRRQSSFRGRVEWLVSERP